MKIIISLFLILISVKALAHQPKLIKYSPTKENPAANPLLFVIGFVCGTTTLHLFGVGIGYFSVKKTLSSIILRLAGIFFAFYGGYLITKLF